MRTVAFISLGLVCLSALLKAETKQSDWDKMFRKPTPAPAASVPDAPVAVDNPDAAVQTQTVSAEGVEVFRDPPRGVKWIVSPAQVAALSPWDPIHPPPPVATPELVNRAMQYAL